MDGLKWLRELDVSKSADVREIDSWESPGDTSRIRLSDSRVCIAARLAGLMIPDAGSLQN